MTTSRAKNLPSPFLFQAQATGSKNLPSWGGADALQPYAPALAVLQGRVRLLGYSQDAADLLIAPVLQGRLTPLQLTEFMWAHDIVLPPIYTEIFERPLKEWLRAGYGAKLDRVIQHIHSNITCELLGSLTTRCIQPDNLQLMSSRVIRVACRVDSAETNARVHQSIMRSSGTDYVPEWIDKKTAAVAILCGDTIAALHFADAVVECSSIV